MFGNDGHLIHAANNAARGLHLRSIENGSESERKAASAYYQRDSRYVGIASGLAFLLLGLVLSFFGFLGWAFVLFFAMPLLISIFRMFNGKRKLQALRDEQTKKHMMTKGDRRYWGRGTSGDVE